MKAFILSGGGNLGSLQAGMLRALLEAEIVPDVLVGTSIGAVNAAYMAAEPSLDQAMNLCEIWSSLRTRDIFSWNPLGIGGTLLRRGAVFPSDRWRHFLEQRIPYERIEDAAVPLRISATDFDDGSSVILDSGSVVDAVMASTSLPGVWPPHWVGGHRYLDGVLSDQVPFKPAIEAGADTVYVLAISALGAPPDLHSAGGILRHSLTVLLFPRIRLDALPVDQDDLRIIQIPSGGAQVSLTDMSRHGELIEQGYQETARFLADQCSSDDVGRGVSIQSEQEVTSETRGTGNPRTQS
ncbi:MAG: patatin-like phospholipase family protein [Actinomycetota bacterium]|jgi:NTE family protein|nr:patatin-like phospholipase family protein [Actinomycetota bacterium]HYZ09100.1 patatin-like phospholipase family protein [Pseudonocardiaceae bacterium]